MSVILYTLSPVFTMILSSVFLKERVSRRAAIGIILGFSGILYSLMLPMAGASSSSFGTLRGNILVLAAVISWTLYTIGSRSLLNRGYPVKAMTGLSMIINAGVFALLTLLTGEIMQISAKLTAFSILQVLYLGVFVSILTFVLYQWTIRHASAWAASLALYLQPLFGVFINYLLLGESLTPEFMVGSTAIIAGVFIATLPEKKPSPDPIF
jgi:drug/metabolite transporter (DMT)-like permease